MSTELRCGQSLRRGTTLVEVLLMTALLTMLIGFSVTLLARSMRISGESQQLQDRHLGVYRLAENFREDLRLADSWEIVSPGELRFNLPGHTVKYLAAEHEVQRQQRGTEDLDDTFRLPRSEVRFEAADSGPLTLLIETEVGPDVAGQKDERSVAMRQLRIEGWKSP
ncbi:MAG: hypothetical protein WDZ51_02020 [Pirellulaceae bacterium]